MKNAQRIKEIRKSNGKNQTQIAEVLQTTQQQYGKYENGKRELPIKHLVTLCKYYNVSADYLLGLIDELRPLR